MQNNTIALFSAPPLLISDSMKAEDIKSGSFFNFSLGGFEIIYLFIGILIVIACIVIILFVIKSKNNGHGFGEKKGVLATLTPDKPPEPPKKWGS